MHAADERTHDAADPARRLLRRGTAVTTPEVAAEEVDVAAVLPRGGVATVVGELLLAGEAAHVLACERARRDVGAVGRGQQLDGASGGVAQDHEYRRPESALGVVVHHVVAERSQEALSGVDRRTGRAHHQVEVAVRAGLPPQQRVDPPAACHRDVDPTGGQRVEGGESIADRHARDPSAQPSGEPHGEQPPRVQRSQEPVDRGPYRADERIRVAHDHPWTVPLTAPPNRPGTDFSASDPPGAAPLRRSYAGPMRATAVLDAALDRSLVLGYTRIGPALRRRWWPSDPAPGLLRGRHVVVTGATSGIGEAMAGSFLALGATVHLLGRNPEKVERYAAELRRGQPTADPDQVVEEVCDVGDLDAVRAWCADLTGRVGALHGLVHNAGVLTSAARRARRATSSRSPPTCWGRT